MILPIVAYGDPVLRKVSEDIDATYPEIEKLLADMWETLYSSQGVGLAAPQINKDIRLFIVDSAQVFANLEKGDVEATYLDKPGVKKVFINAKILNKTGEEWPYQEGCLSIPGIRDDIHRPQTVEITYLDENFVPHTDTFNGLTARIIQHEYDHIEGKLFIDYMKPLKKKLLHKKLDNITKGKVKVGYKMKFPSK